MAMDFEQYAAVCARRRPDCPDWFTQVLHASLGLATAALAILEVLRTDGSRARGARRLPECLEEFEWQRALVYLEFDHRPVPVPASPSTVAVDSALALAVRAGECAGIVNDWMFEGGWLGERLPDVLHELDLHRARLHAALGVDEQAVWARTVARPAPPAHRGSRVCAARPAPMTPARVAEATTGAGVTMAASSPAPSAPSRGAGIHLVLGRRTGHDPRSAA